MSRAVVVIVSAVLVLTATACSGGNRAGIPPATPPVNGQGGAAQVNLPLHYSIADLGAAVYPSAINSSSQIVGTLEPNGTPQEAFLYQSGSLQKLGVYPGDTYSVAKDINDSGLIVGYSQGSVVQHALEFHPGAAPAYLGAPSGFDGSYATGVNDTGQIEGTAYISGIGSTCGSQTGGLHLISFDGHGGASVLKTQGDGVKINDTGTIVYEVMGASVNPCQGSVSPAVYNGTFGVAAPSNFCSNGGYDGQYNINASDINNAGDIVGYYDACDGSGNSIGARGFIADASGTTQIGSTNTHANAINAENWVVGTYAGSNTMHAFVWINGTLTDLNALLPANCGWVLNSAADVNDAGDIVGVGTVGGNVHGFLLTPQ